MRRAPRSAEYQTPGVGIRHTAASANAWKTHSRPGGWEGGWVPKWEVQGKQASADFETVTGTDDFLLAKSKSPNRMRQPNPKNGKAPGCCGFRLKSTWRVITKWDIWLVSRILGMSQCSSGFHFEQPQKESVNSKMDYTLIKVLHQPK